MMRDAVSLSLASLVGLVSALAGCQTPVPRLLASTPPATSGHGHEQTSSAPPKTAPPKTAPAKYSENESETASYRLYKFLNQVGTERDTFIKTDDGDTQAKASFGFKDRRNIVPLAASYVLAPDGTPRRFEVWGNTARQARIDDRVVAEADGSFSVWRLDEVPSRVRAAAPFAMAGAYAPMLGQDLMLRQWVRAGRPATMSVLPAGTISIESRGKDAVDVDGKHVSLEHVSVRGLVWGREDAWIDDAGKLAAVVTRDDEYDLFEAAREDFVALLPSLVARAGADGTVALADAAKSALVARGGAGASVVALVGAQLVDGTGRPPVKDAVVVYDGEKILAAGPRASTPVPAGATSVDVSGKTVLPGLWDMHAHFEQVEQGATYLAAGVTTVRDMGNVLEFITGARDAIAAGKGLGPQIIVDGLVDGEGDGAAGVLRIKSKADIVPMLERLQRAGCPEVKIYSSIAPALVKPIAAEAHRRGMRVVGHVPEGMDILQALDDGFDGVSHLPFLFTPLFRPGEEHTLPERTRIDRVADANVSGPVLQRVIRAFVAKKAFLDDTIALFELFDHTTEEIAQREPGIATLPRELSAMRQGGPNDELASRRAKRFDKALAMLRELHRQGVPIVAGTDIAIPGHTLHRELELYVEAGFTPMEAIQAATSLPARIMHLDKQVGTVAAGKRADLVVVSGDPLTDIHDIRKISAVVARGRTYDPAALWRLAGFTP
ncbi:MAG TPA: amidohydrolase family protein [Polyangiaceae bacterium]|nr:amidohydrolase family protein [Polyangiaceae bacterium]